MKQILSTIIILASGLLTITLMTSNNNKIQEYRTTYVEPYSYGGEEPDLNTLQCPIPMEDRVPNYTGIQCVYSATEMLGRWAEERKLIYPPLTSREECKGYSGPYRLERVLKNLEIRFEQTDNPEKGLLLIKKAMREGRGCLFGVEEHAMVLVHYDSAENKVCWVDNSDRNLKVQTMTIEQFKDKWDYWICIIYADNDVIPYKLGKGPNLIPIKDWQNPQREYDSKEWIIMPDLKRWPSI